MFPFYQGLFIGSYTFDSAVMNLRKPYVHGYQMEPSELIGVICAILGKNTVESRIEAPTSYVPFGHFLADPNNIGMRDVWVVNTSIEGCHWVLAFADVQQDSKRLWVVDPLHAGSQYTATMVSLASSGS